MHADIYTVCKTSFNTHVHHMHAGTQQLLENWDDWEQYVANLPGHTPAEKEMILLSRETREGIKISGAQHNTKITPVVNIGHS